MAGKSYVGAESLTIVKTRDGKQAYVYRGEPVPENVNDAELKRLADEGFIKGADEGFIKGADEVGEEKAKASPARGRKAAEKPDLETEEN